MTELYPRTIAQWTLGCACCEVLIEPGAAVAWVSPGDVPVEAAHAYHMDERNQPVSSWLAT